MAVLALSRAALPLGEYARRMKAAAVLMEILRSAGVRYLFGNPGTTELPFLDALPDSRLEYVLGLQEATAVAAADGYAQASGRVGGGNRPRAPRPAHKVFVPHHPTPGQFAPVG